MKKIKLNPHGIQKSFYNKARIEDWGSIKVLISYKTAVAYIDCKGNFHRLWDDWSVTTMNHINAFRAEYGMSKMFKKDWMKLNVEHLPKNFKANTNFNMDNYRTERELQHWSRLNAY